MSKSLIDFLACWRVELQSNHKPEPVIYIPYDTWYEFNLALRIVLEPHLGQLVTDEAIMNRKEETQLMGFKFRRESLHPPQRRPLLKRPGWDTRYE